MTLVDSWNGPDRLTYRVNRCLVCHIYRAEVVAATVPEFAQLVNKRLAPLIWMAMPVHDEPHPDQVREEMRGPF